MNDVPDYMLEDDPIPDRKHSRFHLYFGGYDTKDKKTMDELLLSSLLYGSLWFRRYIDICAPGEYSIISSSFEKINHFAYIKLDVVLENDITERSCVYGFVNNLYRSIELFNSCKSMIHQFQLHDLVDYDLDEEVYDYAQFHG